MHLNVYKKWMKQSKNQKKEEEETQQQHQRWNNKQITKPIYATDLNSLETISIECE